jgi:pimeloyl-ACP methyl ester carboxylesterase
MLPHVHHYKDKSAPLTILIHGLESSKLEWFEMNGYTKGGAIVEGLKSRNQNFLAIDLYGHGEWVATEPNFDKSDISDELWDSFIANSVNEIANLTNRLCEKFGYQEITLTSYSAGALISVKLVDLLSLPVTGFHFAAPTPEREFDDEYALHNNLQSLIKAKVHIYYGESDLEAKAEDVEWFYDKIEAKSKRIIRYSSGHSLPLEWTNDYFSSHQASQ